MLCLLLCLLLCAPAVFRAPEGLALRARLLGAPVGGGPPARSPHASLRLGVIDLEARPGLAAAHGRRSLALPPVLSVPPVPSKQQGLGVVPGCLARPCRRPRPPVGLRGGLPAEWLRVLDRKLCSG